MKHRQFRQGDILLETLPELPKGVRFSTQAAPLVLARGEATGHAHGFRSKNVRASGYVRDPETGTYCTILEVRDEVAVLEHEEHAPLALPPGVYKVLRQREYVPAGERANSSTPNYRWMQD